MYHLKKKKHWITIFMTLNFFYIMYVCSSFIVDTCISFYDFSHKFLEFLYDIQLNIKFYFISFVVYRTH